jgi:predicted transcriptional regulator
MTTITIEVPDDLAAQLDPAALPMMLRELVGARHARQDASGTDARPQPIYREITNFLASSPTAAQLIAFKISSDAQERLEELLDRRRDDLLSADEGAELDTYLQLSDWLSILKARARSGQPLLG